MAARDRKQAFHCELGFADHSAPGTLDEPVVAFFSARHSLRSSIGGRVWHARQQGLCQRVDVSEQCLLSPRNSEDILSHLVSGGGYAFFRACQTLLPFGQRLLNGVSDKSGRGRKPTRLPDSQCAIACGDEAEPVRQALNAHRSTGVALLRRRFEQAKAKHDLPKDSDPAALARFRCCPSSGAVSDDGADCRLPGPARQRNRCTSVAGFRFSRTHASDTEERHSRQSRGSEGRVLAG